MNEFTAESAKFMTARASEIRLILLQEARADAEEVAELTDLLREELLQLDVRSVGYPDSPRVPGTAKGIGAVLGALIVQLGTLDGIRSVVGAVRGWSARMNRTVEISIDGDVLKVTGSTADQAEKIIDAWIARHARG